jgi:CarD family transcriptional regulator
MAQTKKVPVDAASGAKAAKAKAEVPKKKTVAVKSAATTTKRAVKTAPKAARKSPAASPEKAASGNKVAQKKVAAKAAAAPATKQASVKKASSVKATANEAAPRKTARAPSKRPSATSSRSAQFAQAAQKTAAKKSNGTKSVAAAAPKPAVKKQQPNGGTAGNGGPTIVAPQAPSTRDTKHAGFKTGEYIVYPAHGVGQIVAIEEQEIAGMSLELFVITFEKDKMTLRVPTAKLESVGMRKLAADDVMTKAMATLKGRARVKRTMWSRRAQEYEAKINSGDLVAIAEVVRDLYRSETQPEQSYSERQLYEAALDRMARELAAVEDIDERGAVQRITDVLSKSAKGRRIAEEEAAATESEDADSKAA